MDIVIIFVVVWFACGTLAYGLTFAYFQRKWPSIANLENQRSVDRGFAFLVSFCGPFGLIVAIIQSGFKYGLKYR